LDPRPVMTSLSFRSFPSSDCQTARKRAFRGKIGPYPPQFPSLVELLLHKIRISPRLWDLSDYTELLDSQRLLALQVANIPFYHHYDIQHPDANRNRRNQSDPGFKTMYLTTASLIIVPDHLMPQWHSEILKHTEEGALRVLELARKRDKHQSKIPVARLLASEYDVSSKSPSLYVTKFEIRSF
jgi:hypothetical protein